MLSLTYLSSATHLLDDAALTEILAQSRERNAAAGVTGLLLYRDGNVIQTLEGPHEAVEATFARIARDPRHRGLFVLLREEVVERAFPEWAMAFRRASRREPQAPGFSDYLDAGRREPATDDHSAAERLHASFRSTMR